MGQMSYGKMMSATVLNLKLKRVKIMDVAC